MATPREIMEQLASENENALTADGFEDCLIGICHRFGQPALAAYDHEKCLRKLMKDGMSRDEAVEFFDFNVIGSYVGESTPVFIEMIE